MGLVDDITTSLSSSSIEPHKREEKDEENSRENNWKGGLRLPLGYRFIPSDIELVLHYLFDKIMGLPPPTDIIIDFIDLYEYDPEELPISEFIYGKKNEAYFFTNREERESDTWTTNSGFWKAINEDVPILHLRDQVVGFKKIYIFHRGKAPQSEETPWRMQEFRLNPNICHRYGLDDNLKDKMQKYVICRIRYKDYEDENQNTQCPSLSPIEGSMNDEMAGRVAPNFGEEEKMATEVKALPKENALAAPLDNGDNFVDDFEALTPKKGIVKKMG